MLELRSNQGPNNALLLNRAGCFTNTLAWGVLQGPGKLSRQPRLGLLGVTGCGSSGKLFIYPVSAARGLLQFQTRGEFNHSSSEAI